MLKSRLNGPFEALDEMEIIKEYLWLGEEGRKGREGNIIWNARISLNCGRNL